MSKEHPILFSPDMIRAQLRGIKTMTRRMINNTNSLVDGVSVSAKAWKEYYFNFSQAKIDNGPSPAGNPGPYLKVPSKIHLTTHRIYPKYQPNDILFVREGWKITGWNFEDSGCTIKYADDTIMSVEFDSDDEQTSDWLTWLLKHIEKLEGDGIIKATEDQERFLFTDKPHPLSPGIHLPKWGSRIWHEVIRCYPERIQDITEQDAVKEGMNIIGGQMSARTKFNMLWNEMHPGSWRDNDPVWVTEFKVLSVAGKPESILNVKC